MRYMIRRKSDNTILAKNGKWMEFSAFGDYSWCYKVYKAKGAAQNKVDAYNVNSDRVELIELGPNQMLDASNNVIDRQTED